jgi:BirA family transcriptional regulator, biotin operon repressor / biotin---[acetyl-CoA-carboxylase] ligase
LSRSGHMGINGERKERLRSQRKPLPIEQIEGELGTQVVGRQIHYFPTIGSTNDEAKRLAAAGAPDGTLVIADEQTAGKGRMGRRWVAPPNTCLLMSLVLRAELPPAQAARLTMLCSLAAAEAVEAEAGLRVGIKWPNDLVIAQQAAPDPGAERKVAGLLTETSLIGERLDFTIVGMGINVNLDPAELGPIMVPATSVQAELGRPVDRAALLIAILGRIELRYLEATGAGRAWQDVQPEIHAGWAERLVTVGREVTVTGGESPVHGLAEAVDLDGALLVRDMAGNLHRIVIGDVSLRTT